MMTLARRNFFQLAIVPIALIGSSCASTYKPVNLNGFQYSDKKTQDGVEFSYTHNIQYLSDNAWYTKKERKFHMIAVAIKVVNNSSTPFVLTPENFKVMSADGVEKQFFDPEEYGKKVKQRTGRHMLHALWGPWAVSWSTDNNGNTESHFIYLPVGALVGIGNAVRASNANKHNVQTLKSNSLWDRIVKPGETVTGTILIPGWHGEELTFDLKK
jgi:hypothetical protein